MFWNGYKFSSDGLLNAHFKIIDTVTEGVMATRVEMKRFLQLEQVVS